MGGEIGSSSELQRIFLSLSFERLPSRWKDTLLRWRTVRRMQARATRFPLPTRTLSAAAVLRGAPSQAGRMSNRSAMTSGRALRMARWRQHQSNFPPLCVALGGFEQEATTALIEC